MKPYQIHNRDAGRLVVEIVNPMIEAGGDSSDILVMLETVVAGVLMHVAKDGGDDIVLKLLFDSVRERLQQMRALKIAIADGRP
jgi:hypothetical protein